MEYRLIIGTDYVALSDYYLRNEQGFKIWQPKLAYDFHYKENWKKRISEQLDEQNSGNAYYFVAEKKGIVYGHCTLSQVSRGVFQACYLGFSVCKSYEGKGIAFNLVKHACDYAFGTVKLNRIMAAHIPHNNRSARLLKRVGFKRDGFARNYLKINGNWENHILCSLQAADCR
ncbi:GNAT family N-acetyltransferase [Pseudoalteromonas citrea]|uniref:GNAT family N-acetyltransferase n=1 Tax=Pseudoalteromonas citrea TaxID=43655 RepID=A0A5S3XLC3_9GAMM|nr:GNAT family N-acetyltransferase [Pseudoalteromonas citrea]TMP41131.1 GNAT family N-acetyltransferase [Pseudoalteromonas citrea]TMP56248.1 GNAT family N-acetyltransferase [Pseudoalteromonas citrea]